MLSLISRVLAVLTALCISQTLGVAPTDEYRDADVEQSGYLPNHNMDPAIVDSATFGLLWKFYAKPLTYTPLAGGPQILFLASSMNYIRTLDAVTGALINSRQVHTPFLQSDIGCTDIPNYIGIIGTPVIDPTTDIAYFFSKTYIPNFRVPGNTGTSNGVYYFHAVDVNTLEDVYDPILIDGTFADNAPAKYFVGGVVLQRPSLTQIGSVVYGAFGGHCDLFNYTGLVIGVDVNQAKVVTQWAVESGPVEAAAQTNDLLQDGGGGQGGIWMSGMGLASDGARIFVVTGNGDGHTNNGAPASGSSGLQTLGEAAINLALNNTGNGTLSVSDYFQPYDYQNMDAADQDFGSGGIVLLDPTTFSGGPIEKMAVTAGKNGKVYILDANNLGGYKLGMGQTDGILQTIVTNEAVFGAAGSYPLEGGYIYLTPVGYPTYVYQLGFTSTGIPQFSKVAETSESSAGRVGVGIPTVTTLKGEPGTAILWMTDPNAGIRAWYAVPQNGAMQSIPMPQIGGANKFQRPAFGDGRVYVTDSNGVLYGLGAPVNLPLNCTSPVDFGQVALGTKVTKSLNCTANVPITALDGLVLGDGFFEASNASLPQGPLAAGDSFSFPVTWDLTDAEIKNNPNASSGSISPGIKSAPLTLYTTNGAVGYATMFPISLTGTEVSTAPFLTLAPKTVDYGGIVILNNTAIPTQSGIITISNAGLSPLTILGYGYTNDELIGSNPPNFTNSTLTNGIWDLGLGFTATDLPAIGSQIAPNTAISVDSTFDPVNGVGSYSSYWQVWSDGGDVNIILEGSASTAPIANFSISNGEGGWLPPSNLLMDFGDVAPGSSSSRQIQICNNGGSSLEIDKSKPPNGVFHISDPTELHETQQIPPGECAYGTVLMVANTEEYNQPDLVINNTWTLNTNDLNFGVHTVEITATVVSVKTIKSVGGYKYQGCYSEATNGRALSALSPAPATDGFTIELCAAACQGYLYFDRDLMLTPFLCYCGNSLGAGSVNQTSSDPSVNGCNMVCTGNAKEYCGGPDRLDLYSLNGTAVISAPTGTSPPTTPTSSAGPITVTNLLGYTYLGCYSEATNERALNGYLLPIPAANTSVETCAAACSQYTYFGVEYSQECYCGNVINAGSVNQTSSDPAVNGCNMVCAANSTEYCGGRSLLNMYQVAPIVSSSNSTSCFCGNSLASSSTTNYTDCSMPCTGNPSQLCGGPNRLSLYNQTTYTPPRNPALINSYTYLGCFSESLTTSRLLSGASYTNSTSMTIESCTAFCRQQQMPDGVYAGVEYAQECYCAAELPETAVQREDDMCDMLCVGDRKEYCGGSDLLSVYKLQLDDEVVKRMWEM
ncbi:hypothetical protein M430DRAFT_51625 [Amorphotheca resinae ATCC 22711]|uniref:WSC domain-containing protein n=1 Tax=Amorphotheca resinae ATCC 22711 TaxID=857342 RepID=A0A2T3AY39_AMORE|nr:hypothetical protein M430DRAFT_51625 [Amorphotheca resinae ATCC 22711]PSS14960.1 hypothetical protein M430DRAFT_51625 [Amorphotheca resinae ATCC 22711]